MDRSTYDAAVKLHAEIWRCHFTYGVGAWNGVTSHLYAHPHAIYSGNRLRPQSEAYARVLAPYVESVKNKLMHYVWCDNVVVLAVISIRHGDAYVPGFKLVPPDTYILCRVFVPESESYATRVLRTAPPPSYGANCEPMGHFRMDGGAFFKASADGAPTGPFGVSLHESGALLQDACNGIQHDDGLIVIIPDNAVAFGRTANSAVDRYIEAYRIYQKKRGADSMSDEQMHHKPLWAEFNPAHSETALLGGAQAAVQAPAYVADAWRQVNRDDAARTQAQLLDEQRARDAADIANSERLGVPIPRRADADGNAIPGADKRTASVWRELSKRGIAPMPPGWSIPSAAVQAAMREAANIEEAELIVRRARNAAYAFSENNDPTSRVMAGIEMLQDATGAAINQGVSTVNRIVTDLFNHFYRVRDAYGAFGAMMSAYDMLVVPAIKQQVIAFLEAHHGTPRATNMAKAYQTWTAREKRCGKRSLLGKRSVGDAVEGSENTHGVAPGDPAHSVVQMIVTSRLRNLIRAASRTGDVEEAEDPATVAEHMINAITARGAADLQFFTDAGIAGHSWFDEALTGAADDADTPYRIEIPHWSPPVSNEVLFRYAVQGTISADEYMITTRRREGYTVHRVDTKLRAANAEFILRMRAIEMSGPQVGKQPARRSAKGDDGEEDDGEEDGEEEEEEQPRPPKRKRRRQRAKGSD